MKSLSVVLLCLALECAALSQPADQGERVRAMAAEATAKSRQGQTEEALSLFRQALALEPNNVPVLRDYAVVLGWASQYPQAILAIKKVTALEKEQPDWALREFARTYLFGDATADALKTLDELVERGDNTEQTLLRRGLALRWLGRSDEAQFAYATALERYPDSSASYSGLAYSQADQNKLSDAIRTLDSAPHTVQNTAEIMQARIRILNWMGRHYEAQRLIAALPPEMAESRSILEDRISAARWGGNPAGAMQDLIRLVSLYPDNGTRNLLGELRTEYGHSFIPSFRYTKDSDGLVDRSLSSEAAFHVTPAHVLRLGYQYRWLEQQDVRRLVRYDLGWSGNLNRRISVYTTLSNIDYRTVGLSDKLAGDASLTVAVSDSLRLSGGGGSIIMDAYQSIPKQITAPFGFGDFSVNLGRSTRLQGRYSKFSFSNDVTRDRVDLEVMRSLLSERVRLSAGWRSNFMWHDAYTEDFWSPESIQSHFGVLQASGRITSWLEYAGEVAGGWQPEPDSPMLHPFQVAGRLAWRPGRHWRLVTDVAKSTSSLDRIAPGRRTYSRWSASAGMEFRFP